MMRCAIWAAVSTPGQAADDKASIPSQLAAARAEIARRGWTEVAEFTVPGQSRNITFLHEAMAEIPAMDAMVKAARHREFDLLICYSYDRLARTRALLSVLIDYLQICGVQVYALATPIDPVPPEALNHQQQSMTSLAVTSTLGFTSQMEIETFVRRSRMGKRRQASKGLWMPGGRTPYGYHYMGAGVLQVDPAAGPVVAGIFERYCAGYGTPTIARELNAAGVPSPKGGLWSTSELAVILRNPVYCGRIVYGAGRSVRIVDPETGIIRKRRERVDDPVNAQGRHEAIVSEAVWNLAQAERRRRSGMAPRSMSDSGLIWPLSGLMRCGHCGGGMALHFVRRSQRGYTCCTHVMGMGCGLNWIGVQRAESEVAQALQELLRNPAGLELALATPPPESQADEMPLIESALADLPPQRQRWDAAYQRGALTLDEYAARVLALRDRERDLREQLSSLRAKSERASDLSRRRERLLALSQVDLRALPREDLKALYRSILSRVTVTAHHVTGLSIA